MTDLPSLTVLTAEYERWLSRHLRPRHRDLAKKHAAMAADAFSCFRATYYWWAQAFPVLCPALAAAPRVLAAGDLHIDNFGTWRDAEGRLAWGVNDLDEVAELPFTSDLVRLLTSALLARVRGEVAMDGDAMAGVLLDGYRTAVERGGHPFVLSEVQTPLREMARARLHEPEHFWARIAGLPEARRVPVRVRRRLLAALPPDAVDVRWLRRTSGLGSLGRVRYVALARVAGAHVAREAKASVPAATVFAAGRRGALRMAARERQQVATHAPRARDPFLAFTRRWIIRRLAPDCSRIELTALPDVRNERELLWAMGAETANLHLASGAPTTLLEALDALPRGWLEAHAHQMHRACREAWASWVRAAAAGDDTH